MFFNLLCCFIKKGSKFYVDNDLTSTSTKKAEAKKVSHKEVPVKPPRASVDVREQKREDPEGMTMSKDDQHTDNNMVVVYLTKPHSKPKY